MPAYDGSKIDGLTDTDKMRLIAAYLSHNEPNNVNWDTAIILAGSASKDSYKKMLASSLKKLVSAAAKDEGTTAPAPPGAPKKGRKRATPATEDDDAEFKGVKKAKKVAKLRGKKAKKQEDEEADNETV
ncbi:hypothetical protein MPH_08030 [Macrophomina phaseolina MS6]|uniref:Uncharacterized protein n=1 Tax=Macrophomina phaseolina (strain MS6) TaxID=1126212 RepID=K2SD37_MACPH|nr:hypothetical protein MPH_08030 [Macrophomina phaseolina MS6]